MWVDSVDEEKHGMKTGFWVALTTVVNTTSGSRDLWFVLILAYKCGESFSYHRRLNHEMDGHLMIYGVDDPIQQNIKKSHHSGLDNPRR